MRKWSRGGMAVARRSGGGQQKLWQEHARGALLGLFVGDAAGATLEFLRQPITAQMAERAMRMPGSGWVGPGQVTDDSELAIALALALRCTPPSLGLPLDAIALHYRAWFASKPFDVGSTCALAFRSSMAEHDSLETHLAHQSPPSIQHLIAETKCISAPITPTSAPVRVVEDASLSMTPTSALMPVVEDGSGAACTMMKAALQFSSDSEANGALMRITPMAIWLAGASPAEHIAWAAKQDSLLSHPSPVCQECNAAYTLTIAHLLRHPRDRHGALTLAQEYAHGNMHTKAKHWLLEDSLDISHLNCTLSIGHVRHAFTLAFFFLRQAASFEDAMSLTLQRGGDTDTNAAIVGSLIGALHGADAIPTYMKDAVLRFDCCHPRSGQIRPRTYSTQQIEELLHGLLCCDGDGEETMCTTTTSS